MTAPLPPPKIRAMPERPPPVYPLRFKEIYKDKIWGGPELAKVMVTEFARWRAEALEKVGYDPSSAAALAVRHDVDLHRAIQLVERGCPPDMALRILL